MPQEWNIRDAWIKDSRGERIVDFRAHNLHVLNYSMPVQATPDASPSSARTSTRDPAQPDRIPYRTSYYQANWGFCLPHAQLEALPEDRYEVMIDATLADGALTYGECFLPGSDPAAERGADLHPRLPSLARQRQPLGHRGGGGAVARLLARQPPRLGYRFLFIPGTIGSITWLALNEARLGAIRHGLVLANLGDPGRLHYKRSRRGDAAIDRAAAARARPPRRHAVLRLHPLRLRRAAVLLAGLRPAGRLPVAHALGPVPGVPHLGRRPGLRAPRGARRLRSTPPAEILRLLERDRTWRNLAPKGEPQLGRRGLYDAIGGRSDAKARQMALLWVLNLSDGRHSLLDIAERSGLDFALVADAAEPLAAHALLAPEP